MTLVLDVCDPRAEAEKNLTVGRSCLLPVFRPSPCCGNETRVVSATRCLRRVFGRPFVLQSTALRLPYGATTLLAQRWDGSVAVASI